MRIACLGGSFNPIHHGHLIAACEAMRHHAIDRIVLMVSGSPPHKPGDALAPAEDRLTLARLAVDGDRRFEVSDLEVRRPGPSYTIDTVIELKRGLASGDELLWIIGSDSVGELHTWHRIADLLNEARLITVSRTERPFADADRLRQMVGEAAVSRLQRDAVVIDPIGISSTAIRRLLAEGKSARYYAPPDVLLYINAHGLYRRGGSGIQTDGR